MSPMEQMVMAICVTGITCFYGGRLSARIRKLETSQVQINVLLAGCKGAPGYLEKLDSTRKHLDDHLKLHDSGVIPADVPITAEQKRMVDRVAVTTARAIVKQTELAALEPDA